MSTGANVPVAPVESAPMPLMKTVSSKNHRHDVRLNETSGLSMYWAQASLPAYSYDTVEFKASEL